MNVTHDNFIGIYEDLFPSEYCEKAIQYFKDMTEAGFVANRQQLHRSNPKQSLKTFVDDSSLFAHAETEINLTGTRDLRQQFNEVFWSVAYKSYVSEYSIVDEGGAHSSYAFKLQKTMPGEGYHIWHYESDTRANCHRLLTWMLYLNDVEEGGETEFLYLHKRIKPKAGTLLIWPAAFTHTHRGNPPLSGPKYVITGWTEF